jgi:hypothetical protein
MRSLFPMWKARWERNHRVGVVLDVVNGVLGY